MASPERIEDESSIPGVLARMRSGAYFPNAFNGLLEMLHELLRVEGKTLEKVGTSDEEMEQLAVLSRKARAQFLLASLRKGRPLIKGQRVHAVADILVYVCDTKITDEELGTSHTELATLCGQPEKVILGLSAHYEKKWRRVLS